MEKIELANVVDNLIRVESSLSELYGFFAEIFKEDADFFNQLALEETGHANLLENYKNVLPLEFQKMNKKDLIQIESEIKTNLDKFKSSPPSIETALNFAFLIENNSGEIHYQALIDSKSFSERVQVFKVLNLADKDHAKRINSYLIKKSFS